LSRTLHIPKWKDWSWAFINTSRYLEIVFNSVSAEE